MDEPIPEWKVIRDVRSLCPKGDVYCAIIFGAKVSEDRYAVWSTWRKCYLMVSQVGGRTWDEAWINARSALMLERDGQPC